MVVNKINEKEESLKRLKIVQNALLIVGIVILVLSVFTIWWPGFILAALLLFVGLLNFTTVGVSRAKMIERFRGFRKCIADLLPGEVFDEEYNIVPKEKATSRPKIGVFDQIFDSFAMKYLGGIRLTGIRGIDDYRRGFKLRRTAYEITSKKTTEIVSRTEESDELYLQWDKYPVIVENVQTAERERFVPKIELAFTGRVHNAVTVVYIGDPNWVENVATELRGIMRDWAVDKTIDGILTYTKENPAKFFNEIKQHPNFEMITKKWGAEIAEPGGVQIMAVELPPDIQQALEKEKEEEYLARGFAQRTIGVLLAMESIRTGKPIDVIRSEIEKDPEKVKALNRTAQKLLAQQISADSGSLLHIKTDETSGDIFPLIAAAGQLFRREMPNNRRIGSGPKNKQESKEKPGQGGTDEKKTKKPEEMTPEERETEVEKILKEGF